MVLDILLAGEQNPDFSRSTFGAMLLATVGERALGVAVSQLNAIINYNKDKNITLVGKGIVCSTVALLSAALKYSGNIEKLELIELPVSLKQLIKNKIEYDKYPELYCFGLLRYFDIKEYIGMAAPANVQIVNAVGKKEMMEKEFEPLKEFYQKWTDARFKYY
jgi:hypothetical protein